MASIAKGLREVRASDVHTDVIFDSGHWPAEEQPDQVIEALSEFIDSID
jgi:pimeloyl-ACP methyl ester carboxylesterase